MKLGLQQLPRWWTGELQATAGDASGWVMVIRVHEV